ncbi:MAG: C4-dicarboxylate ABC transporter substrate-binding protein [Chitinivibrionales bacterium]|nr:C4-dicarboxylate ABC transporter substrate-binding protein [Chitinivibrionales bacterium]
MTFVCSARRIPAVVLLAAWALSAATIKMGSIAPSGSPWDDGLRKIAAEWAEISGGSVTLKIYPGGIAGDEEDMIRKMRIGQLDAAGMSGMGLSRIYSGILAVQLPLLVRNDEELVYVLDKMKPTFEQKLEAKGFKVLIWNNVGWAHFFSKRPVVQPQDLRGHKLFTYAGDPDGIQAWKDAGFNPVPLSVTDLVTSLQSGMVDAFTMTPLSAASYQAFALAPNMCGMKWAPLVGGVVIATRAWKKVPEELRPRLLESAQRIGAVMQEEINGADDQAIAVMKKHGLTVHPTPADAVQEWESATKKAFAAIAGKSFEAEAYEQVLKHLKEYRSNHAQ